MSLKTRLVERIRAVGSIGFDEVMAVALYDPTDGFYTANARGPGADFITSPLMSPLFGATLAAAVTEQWNMLVPPPRPMTLCEIGTGTGALIADLLGAAADTNSPWIGDLEVVLVDPALPGVNDASGEAPPGFSIHRDLADMAPFDGVVIANEVLDNLPVRLLAADGSEIMVAEVGGELSFTQPDASLGWCTDPVGVRSFLGQLARVVRRGSVILIDFAGTGLRTYAGHHLGDDVLAHLGCQDITAPVDWDAVEEAAAAAGLRVIERTTQRDYLLRLGLGTSLDAYRAAELDAVRREAIGESLQMRDRRTRAATLIDPGGVGAFTVMVLAAGGGW